MRQLLFAMGLSVCASAAMAGEYRTVTWYANNPTEMAGVLRLCRDNAGLAKHNPNCTNADEAQIIVAEREMSRGNTGSPYSARYWNVRPNDRRQQVWACDLMDKSPSTQPDPKTRRICLAARSGG